MMKSIFSVFSVIALILIFYEILSKNLKGFILMDFALLVILAFFLWTHSQYKDFRAYEFATELSFTPDGFIYKTAGEQSLEVAYEDIGLIVDINAFTDAYGADTYTVPYTIFVYYNSALKRCVNLYLDKDAGYEVIKKYREYIGKTGTPSCPFIRGKKHNGDEINMPIDRLKSSPFCKRWQR